MPTIPIEKQSSDDQRAAAAKPAVRLWDRDTTCAFFGGIDISTLYRGMAAKPPRYPRPVLVSAHVARWLADECETALARMIAERDKPKPPRSGRKGRRIERAEREAAAAVKIAAKLEAASKAKTTTETA